MSKIGRQPVAIPEGVIVEIKDQAVTVSGPKGTLSHALPLVVSVTQDDSVLNVKSKDVALWGTWRAHIANMVKGVVDGFEKSLELRGVGYRVQLQGSTLNFQLGFSHPVVVDVPEGLSCEVKEGVVTLRGINKEHVGQFAARIRSLRPPDAYKGKGIRYKDEVVHTKPGKKAGVTA
jgi:large subunit ribosomal protein L6